MLVVHSICVGLHCKVYAFALACLCVVIVHMLHAAAMACMLLLHVLHIVQEATAAAPLDEDPIEEVSQD